MIEHYLNDVVVKELILENTQYNTSIIVKHVKHVLLRVFIAKWSGHWNGVLQAWFHLKIPQQLKVLPVGGRACKCPQ